MLALAPVPQRTGRPQPPRPRGTLSEALLGALEGRPRPVGLPTKPVASPLTDDDLQLALYCAYELHYRGFEGVDDGWEWQPSLLGFRAALEDMFLEGLRVKVGRHADSCRTVDGAARALWTLATTGDGPSLSGFVAERASLAQVRELAVHRSPYQLKEADPHTWVIPRLSGRAKATVVSIQHDEYGAGEVGASHAALFADTMTALGLDPTYGAYLDIVPGYTLATTNLISFFGLHRRWRGALVGHLALFEMTSVGPMGRYSAALERLGLGRDARRFYDVHVLADEIHQHLAVDGMVAGLLEDEPELADDVLFGARAVTALERTLATSVLDAWSKGRSSLLSPID